MRPVLAILVIGTASLVRVQGAAPPQFSARDTEQPVIIEGCLSGTRLKPELTHSNTRLVFETLDIKELHLEGTKALLKEHDGHQDEISGVVLVPRDRDVQVQGKKVGSRTRITGTTSVGNPDPKLAGGGGRAADPKTSAESQRALEARKWLRMKVTSVRHLSDKCLVPGGGLFTKDGPKR